MGPNRKGYRDRWAPRTCVGLEMIENEATMILIQSSEEISMDFR